MFLQIFPDDDWREYIKWLITCARKVPENGDLIKAFLKEAPARNVRAGLDHELKVSGDVLRKENGEVNRADSNARSAPTIQAPDNQSLVAATPRFLNPRRSRDVATD